MSAAAAAEAVSGGHASAATAAAAGAHPYGPQGKAVLHVDVDAFFCQVRPDQQQKQQAAKVCLSHQPHAVQLMCPSNTAYTCSFFVLLLLLPAAAAAGQVEVLRNPSALQGKPVAIQQDQDVIAVNYPARQAGVKKHMPIDKVWSVHLC